MKTETLGSFAKRRLLPRLAERVIELGFQPYKRADYLFVREVGPAAQAIFITMDYFQPRLVDFIIGIHVSIHSVAERLAEIGFYDRSEGRFRTTLNRNIGHIMGIGYHKYTVNREDSVSEHAAILDDIRDDIRDYSIPYMDRYSTEEAVFDLAYSPANPVVFPLGDVHYASLVAIILAEKLGRTEVIPEVIEYTWRHLVIHDWHDSYREAFRRYVDRLGYGQYLPSS